MAEESFLIFRIKEIGFKRSGRPRVEMITYTRGGGLLSIKVSTHGVHLSASGVNLSPDEWKEVVLKVSQAEARVAACPKSE